MVVMVDARTELSHLSDPLGVKLTSRVQVVNLIHAIAGQCGGVLDMHGPSIRSTSASSSS